MRKTSIAKSIKQTRENPTKNRRKLDDTLDYSKKREHEGWNGCDGRAHRYKKIYTNSLKHRPFDFLLEELKVHDPNVMILGPGKGEDSYLFKKELGDIGVNIHLDTLGFSKTVHKELVKDKIIRKDYSPNISKGLAFEHINPIEHPKLVKAITGKYHLVVAERSVGVYSESKPYALFQTALLLKKRGRAYIDLEYTGNLKEIITIAGRMLDSYNKTNKTDIKFKIKALKDTAGSYENINEVYVQIDRVN